MKHTTAFFTLSFLFFTSLGFANVAEQNPPVIGGTQLMVTDIIPTQGATKESCEIYNRLKNKPIIVNLPAALHSSSVYQVAIDNVMTTMSTDNGWGDPFYLYGSNVQVGKLILRDFFVIFSDNKYNQVTQLVMRGSPTSIANQKAANTEQPDCRIIGTPLNGEQ